MEKPYVFRAVSEDVIGHNESFKTPEDAKASLKGWWPLGESKVTVRGVGNHGEFRVYYDGSFQGTVCYATA